MTDVMAKERTFDYKSEHSHLTHLQSSPPNATVVYVHNLLSDDALIFLGGDEADLDHDTKFFEVHKLCLTKNKPT